MANPHKPFINDECICILVYIIPATSPDVTLIFPIDNSSIENIGARNMYAKVDDQ